MNKIKKILLCCFLSFTTMTMLNVKVNAETIDWKTNISSSPYKLDEMFEKYEEPKTLYTTTGVNMRRYPNTKYKNVEKVLYRNTKVNAIAEYNGWTQVIAKGKDNNEHVYYVWNQYLSDKKTIIKKSVNTSSTNYSSNKYLGNFKLTAYCNCSKCCGKWAGGATASGKIPSAGRTVAMAGVPFGTKLLINGHVYIVEDRGTSYGHVDIFFNTHSEALQFGMRYADVYKVS